MIRRLLIVFAAVALLVSAESTSTKWADCPSADETTWKAGGAWKWPPNHGCEGEMTSYQQIAVGDFVDRYGSYYGKFVSKMRNGQGPPYGARSMPYMGFNQECKNRYHVAYNQKNHDPKINDYHVFKVHPLPI